jgi:ABC-type antimicrobial peptide transport system permease subunit
VLGDGLRVIVAGAVVGTLAAIALARVVASALYQVSPYDPLTFACVPLLVGAAGLVAAALPARAAARTDPQQSLRCE